MINTGLELAPDMECTWWPEGIPNWLGGNGDEWLHCCVAHDLGGSDLALMNCVVESGWPVMGLIMFAGLIIFGPLYQHFKYRNNQQA